MKLQIEIVRLGDFFYARSDDVPGLHVVSKTLPGLYDSVFRAIGLLLKIPTALWPEFFSKKVEMIENFEG